MLEKEIERRIEKIRRGNVAKAELSRARGDLLSQLDRDEETSADAAHQMAFFAGDGAFDVLTALPQRLAAVTPPDLRRVAARWLQPWQRTIGLARRRSSFAGTSHGEKSDGPISPGLLGPCRVAAAAPRVKVLANGVALIVRRVPRIAGGSLRVLAAGAETADDEPVWRHTALGRQFPAGGLATAALRIRRDLAKLGKVRPERPSDDPETRLRQMLREVLGTSRGTAVGRAPAVVVAVGDLDEDEALATLARTFGPLPSSPPSKAPEPVVKAPETVVRLAGKAQSQLGYALPIDGPRSPALLAWRLLLYIMAHDYEGRLGRELIARRGLAYFIDARVHADRDAAWTSMTLGVNPDRLAATRQRFGELMADLRLHPPTEAEVDEAKTYLVGRRLTAPQSDDEMAAFLGREWIEQGRLLSQEEWEERVRAVSQEDVLRLVPRFLAGATAVVDTPDRYGRLSSPSPPVGWRA